MYKIPEFDEFYLNYDTLNLIIQEFVAEKIKKTIVNSH